MGLLWLQLVLSLISHILRCRDVLLLALISKGHILSSIAHANLVNGNCFFFSYYLRLMED
jgi:hypothetical protein